MSNPQESGMNPKIKMFMDFNLIPQITIALINYLKNFKQEKYHLMFQLIMQVEES